MKRSSHLALGCLLFALTGYLDFFTGPRLSPTLFYLIPVIYFGFFLGGFWGILASWFGAGLWLIFEILSNTAIYRHTPVPYWNAAVQLCIFLTVSFAVIQLESELRRTRKQNQALQEANEIILKLSETRTRFATMVSHELRTPMAAIKESLTGMELNLEQEKQKDFKVYLQIASRNIDRLVHLANSVLEFSSGNSGRRKLKRVKNEMNQIIKESAALYEPLTQRKGLSLTLELDPKLAMVFCDRDAIAEVIGNLLGNAIKFTRQGGIHLRSSLNASKVEVCVSDTGCGIRKESLSSLFLPFSQSLQVPGTQASRGAGLGLAISKSIIELHGGKIWAESEAGKGTALFFSIPGVQSKEAVL